MKQITLLVVWLQVLVTPVLLRKIPSFVPLCKRNDPELSKCIINSVNTIRPYLVKGIPEMDLPQGDPLHYYDTSVNASLGRVEIVGKTWNQTAYELMNFDLRSIKMDFENAKCYITMFFPKLKLEGKYNLKGKVVLFEIDSIGTFYINTTNVLANAEFIGRYYTKESKQYVEFQQVILKLDLGDTKLYFENLVNGNEELTVTVNRALNDNIETVVDDFRPIFQQSLEELLKIYFNTVYQLFPIDILFPTE